MNHRIRGLRVAGMLPIAAVAALALSACGGSSNGATGLLEQTFTSTHTVKSGNLHFSLTVNPSGSSTLTGPIAVSFGGPFQSLGPGKLPASNFNISLSALGQAGSVGILSTGTSGYVTLQGTSYQLPPATFQKLESSFARIAASPGAGGGSGAGALAKLGLRPLRWLTNPSVVGTENVGGTSTTHIRAHVNVDALLADLGKFLQKASSLGVSGASGIPSFISDATRRRIASQVTNPSFDVWTGTNDKTIRKLAIGLTVPVSGQISSLLGGLRAAQIGVSLTYADLNQPQTIQAPASVRPFSEFGAKLRAFLGSIQNSVAGSALGATGATGATGAAATVQAYSRCIQAAGGDVRQQQRCQTLLNAK